VIYQRRHSLHTRDRDIANMPLQPDHAGESWYVSLALWIAMVLVIVACAVAFA